MFSKALVAVLSLATFVSAHYTLPSLIINGQATAQWTNVRQTNNYNSQAPVTDVASADFRCYTSATNAKATTIDVTAGSTIGVQANGPMYHAGVVNVYLAKAPSGIDVASWDGAGQVWFKVHEISAVTDGGKTITFPAQDKTSFTFTLPKNLPNGQYLLRTEQIALHSASSYQGAQFYISCGQINVSGGGSGSPSPLVSIPGVYTGRESGIMLNIYYPVPPTYTQPGPAVWRG